MQAEPISFARQWFRLNAAAMLLGYLVYTPIAHGVTGAHGRELTVAQLAAHSIALGVVAMMVASAQRHVLARFVVVTRARVAAAIVGFIAAFWIGYYQPFRIGPDTDMILGFLVLGSAVWIGAVPASGHRVAAAIALLCFPLSGVVAQASLVLAMTVFDFTLEPRTDMLHHSLVWITTGGGAGLLGGWAGGLALSRLISTPSPRAAGRVDERLRPT